LFMGTHSIGIVGVNAVLTTAVLKHINEADARDASNPRHKRIVLRVRDCQARHGGVTFAT
jgi:hypothetical protein